MLPRGIRSVRWALSLPSRDARPGSSTLRVALLRNGGGLNGSNVLNSTTVPNDSSIDTFTGGLALDWFFANLPQDTISDFIAPEQIN